MKTYFPSAKEIQPNWRLLDATDQKLGRLATLAAHLLMGKDDPRYTPFMDLGTHVIVVNAAKISISGSKLSQKEYHRYTGYPGGLRTESLANLMRKNPEMVIRRAIERMLPKNKLGHAMGKKLRVYRMDVLPHEAQAPTVVTISRKVSRPASETQAIEAAFDRWISSLNHAERNLVVVRTSSEGFSPVQLREEIRRGTAVGRMISRSLCRLQVFDFGNEQSRVPSIEAEAEPSKLGESAAS